MYLWQAALCVLYERDENEGMTYTEVADEILRRGLFQFSTDTPAQSVGTIMRGHGHGHFYAEGGGYYRLRNPATSADVYERLTRSFPYLFPAHSAAPPSIEHSVDRGTTKSSVANSAASETSEPPARKKTAAQKSHWDVSDLSSQIIAEEVPTAFEGRKKQIYVNAYERDQNARKLCIQAHGFACVVCRMKFEDQYGDVGRGFIHVHHLLSLSLVGARETNPIDDLRPVCPNCHAMLHRGESTIGRPYSIDELGVLRRKAQRRIAEQRRKKCKRAR